MKSELVNLEKKMNTECHFIKKLLSLAMSFELLIK